MYTNQIVVKRCKYIAQKFLFEVKLMIYIDVVIKKYRIMH